MTKQSHKSDQIIQGHWLGATEVLSGYLKQKGNVLIEH